MRRINVGILGGSMCCPNLGVGALTIAQCNILNGIAEQLDTVFDVIIYEAIIQNSYVTNFNALNIMLDTYSSRILDMRKKISRHQIIIDLYGGDSFSDIYSRIGFIIGALQRIAFVKNTGIYILSPQTIGPFNSSLSILLKRFLLRITTRVFLRDNDSMVNVEYQYREKTTASTDMAFRLPFDKQFNEKFIVGINISGLLWNGSIISDNVYEYRESIHSIITECLNRGLQVMLIPHVIEQNEAVDGDYTVSKIVADKYGGKVLIAPRFKNPVQAKSFISGLSVFIGSRMHATIAAVSCGVPTIALSYSPKFSGVFHKLNYQNVMELSNVSSENVRSAFIRIIENYDESKIEVVAVQERAESELKVYDEYLKVCFEKLAMC